METTRTQIGKNILLIDKGNVVLRKTTRSKTVLAFWTFLQLALIFAGIFLIAKSNQPLHWPATLEGRLLLPFVVGGIVFLIYWTLRSTLNEWKDYVITQNKDEIIVNGRSFAELLQTEIIVKEKVGQDGIGVAYEVRLKHNRKKLILSFGNRLNEAKEVASLIGSNFGLEVRESRSS
jgi:hypothetical protein